MGGGLPIRAAGSLDHGAIVRLLGPIDSVLALRPAVDGDALVRSLKEIAPKILPFMDPVWRRLAEARKAGYSRILLDTLPQLAWSATTDTFTLSTAAASFGFAVRAIRPNSVK